jgi:flagellar hook-associated protein 3 FlgL
MMSSWMSLGDAARSFAMARHQAEMKSALNRAATEVTTGRTTDPGRALGGDFRALSALDTALARLAGHQSVLGEADLFATATQAALGTVSDRAEALATTLLTAAGSGRPGDVDVAAASGRSDLATLFSALNTRVGDRSLFSGTATQTAPLPDPAAFMAILATAIGPQPDAGAAAAAIDAWFADPAGFAATYQGGAALAPFQIAPGDTADPAVTALDPGLRETIKATATAALLDQGLLAGAPDERRALLRQTAERLLTGASERSALAARVGRAEERIAAARAENGAERTSLGIARAGTVEVDLYEAATRLQTLETQMQSLYTITARLSRLNLSDYL